MPILRNIYLIFILSLIFGCKQKEIEQSNKTNEETLEQKIKSKPNIFLKFWKNMSKKEFDDVCDLLIKEGSLRLETGRGLVYDTGKNNLKISSFNFSENYENSFLIDCNGDFIDEQILKNRKTIDGIKLYDFNSEMYNIYKEKYGLPDYIIKSRLIFRLEENPLHNNLNNNEKSIGKLIKFLNESEYNDITKQDKWSKLSYITDYSKRITIEKDTILENDKAILLFKECKDKCLREPLYIFYEDDSNSETNNNEKTISFGNKNSKLRIVVYEDRSYLSLIYLDKGTYKSIIEKKKKREQENLDNINRSKELEEKRKEKRIKEHKNEI